VEVELEWLSCRSFNFAMRGCALDGVSGLWSFSALGAPVGNDNQPRFDAELTYYFRLFTLMVLDNSAFLSPIYR
jgi:hypothetical protein